MKLFDRKSRLMLVLGFSLIPVLMGGCQRATIKGARVGSTQPITITKLYIYSFLNVNPGFQSARFRRDVAAFENALAARFALKGVPAVAVDGTEQAGLNGFSANAMRHESYRGVTFSGTELVPVKAMVASNRQTEIAFGATHRLILFPAMMSTSDGATYGSDIAWSLQSTDSNATLAQGSLHYILDIRGFPSQ